MPSPPPLDHDEVDFDDLIQQVDPQLWNAACLLTRSTSELRGTSKVNDPLSPAYHKKSVRCLFLLCTILFCTDDRCSMPLHTLMTDTIESQGGSVVLIKILNRLGVCASADTLSRFIQYKASTFRKNKMKYLSPDSFTVVSADNIDFMHSFARVFCGNQMSSWHGTTVQAVQPLPSLTAGAIDLVSCVSPVLDDSVDPRQVGTGLRLPSHPSVDPSLEDTEELMDWVFGTELETIPSDLDEEDDYESD